MKDQAEESHISAPVNKRNIPLINGRPVQQENILLIERGLNEQSPYGIAVSLLQEVSFGFPLIGMAAFKMSNFCKCTNIFERFMNIGIKKDKLPDFRVKVLTLPAYMV